MTPLLALVIAASALPAPVAPDRLFDCELGRVTNLQAKTSTELGLVGNHRIVVLQPGDAVELESLPPRPPYAAWLVKVYDPDRVVGVRSFDTVLDAWPRQVDFMEKLANGERAFISFAKVDPATATLTVSAGIIAAGAEAVATDRFLQGQCRYEIGTGLAAKFDRLKGAKP